LLERPVIIAGKFYPEGSIIAASDEYMRKKIGISRIIIKEELPVFSWARFKLIFYS